MKTEAYLTRAPCLTPPHCRVHPGYYLTAESLAKAKNLKYAVTAGIRSDRVDLNAAYKTNGGITVAELTDSNVMVCKGIRQIHKPCQAKTWSERLLT